MDNQNNLNQDQNVNQTPSQPQPMSPPVMPAPPVSTQSIPPTPPKKQRNWLVIGAIAVLILLLATLVPLAYFMGKDSDRDAANSAVVVPESDTDVTPTDEIEENEIEVVDEYSGWTTYEHPTLPYSFKYPADWQLNREMMHGGTDWITLALPGQGTPVGGDYVVSFFTYLDGTGCPVLVERQFTIGAETVTASTCEGDTRYHVMMQDASGKWVGVRINMAKGNDEAVAMLLKSVTGLKPLQR